MDWKNLLHGDPVPWLLDADTPGVPYLVLRDLLDCPPDNPDLASAKHAAYQAGPIATVLANIQPDGYWVEPGPGYNPKYFSTVWSLILLAELGASLADDERIARACGYILDHALTSGGQFSASGAPSGTADCLQGDLCWALVTLGCIDHRLVEVRLPCVLRHRYPANRGCNVKSGVRKRPRLEDVARLVLGKQDRQGCWPLEYDYNGKTWRM